MFEQLLKIIFIRGSPEATKLAHSLIATMIRDPDVDIMQILPPPRPKGPTSTLTSIWEKTVSFRNSTNKLWILLLFNNINNIL